MTRRGIRRRAALALALGLASLRTVPPRPEPAPLASPPVTDAARAIRAYQALQLYFAVPGANLLREWYPAVDGNPLATLWPYSQALVAALHLSGLPVVGNRFAPDVQQRLAGLAAYWNPSSAPRSFLGRPTLPGYASSVVPAFGLAGDLYYDDNNWVALAFVERYHLAEDHTALDRAGRLFELLTSGWDTDPRHPCPGGVFWTLALGNSDRNTVSTAPAAEVGAHLYILTHRPAYLEWATRMYDWVNRYLRAPNGLYWDHLDQTGAVNTVQWTYNQGAMLGAAVLLHAATDQASYLERAQQIADASLELYDHPAGFLAQPVPFNAIFFKNLLRLAAVRPDPRYRDALRRYADSVWQAVDPSTGLLRLQPSEPVKLLDQAALVQIIALLAWDPERYSVLA